MATIEADNNNCPPLPKATVAADIIIPNIVTVLLRSGISKREILSAYRSEPIIWPIPSLYGTLQGDFVGFNAKVVGDGGAYREFWREVETLVKTRGLNYLTRPSLETYLGSIATHPRLLSDVPATPQGLNTFRAQVACLMGGAKGSLIFSDTECYFSYGNQRMVRLPIGLTPKDGASLLEIEAAVCTSGDFIVYDTFNTLDRCFLASEGLVPEIRGEVVRALAIMKMTRNSLLPSYLEDYIYQSEEYETSFTGAEAEVMFLDDSLNIIRDLWYDHTKEPHETFRNLFSYLVPHYLDGLEFEKMFKSLPNSFMKFDIKRIDTINKGMGVFEGWFLQMQKSVKEGKLRFRG